MITKKSHLCLIVDLFLIFLCILFVSVQSQSTCELIHPRLCSTSLSTITQGGCELLRCQITAFIHKNSNNTISTTTHVQWVWHSKWKCLQIQKKNSPLIYCIIKCKCQNVLFKNNYPVVEIITFDYILADKKHLSFSYEVA